MESDELSGAANEALGHERRLAVAVINPTTRIGVARAQSLLRQRTPSHLELITIEVSPNCSIGELLGPFLDDAAVAIAIGGDGTVSAVGAALLGRDIPLGIVPGGSTNMIAKVSHIPRDPARAIQLVFGRHHRQRIDVGRCGDRVLLHLGGVGLDARLFARADPALKRKIGWLAYVPAGVQSIASPVSTVTIRVDGTSLTAQSKLVLVANSAELVSSRFPLVPGVARADGSFDVLIFTATSPVDLGRSALRFATRGLMRSPFVTRLHGREIRITADPPLPVEIDGELAGSTPLEIIVEHRALELITGRP